MSEHKTVTIVLAMALLLLAALMALAPGSEAKEHNGIYQNLEIQNNEYWSENIAYNDVNETFEFFVTEVKELSIDVYILNSVQFDLYKNNLPFIAEYSNENTASTGIVNWTCPDDDYYYLVVDNKKNAHIIDAYAMQDVFVDISWMNMTDQGVIGYVSDSSNGIGRMGMCCLALVVLIPLVLIGVFANLIREMPSGTSYNTQYPPQLSHGGYPQYQHQYQNQYQYQYSYQNPKQMRGGPQPPPKHNPFLVAGPIRKGLSVNRDVPIAKPILEEEKDPNDMEDLEDPDVEWDDVD